MPTFCNELLQVWVKSQPMAFPPEPHVGRVVLSVALINSTHGKELPPVSCQEKFPFPAVQPRPAGPEGQIIVRVINEARVIPAVGEAFAAVPVFPGICFIPMVRADRHSQHAKSAQR